MGDDDWRALLPTWRQRNWRDDITSVLLHDQGSLMQLLEGPVGQVTRLFDAIQRDPRHRGLTVLVAEAAAHRLLPGRQLLAVRRGDDLVRMALQSEAHMTGKQAPAAAHAEVNEAGSHTATDDAVWAVMHSFGRVRYGGAARR